MFFRLCLSSVQEAYLCASLAVGCTLEIVNSVCAQTARSGVAIVRFVNF